MIISKTLNFYSEYKYDGERIQIHKFNQNVKIYSRNLENQIQKYLDMVPVIKSLNDKNFILDCEVVAYDTVNSKILPFNVLATRKKKVSKVNEIKDNACIFCFDVLFYNENDLLNKKLYERKKILEENFKEIKNKFYFTTTKICNDVEETQIMFDESIKNNCEGLMIKSYNGIYMPSKKKC